MLWYNHRIILKKEKKKQQGGSTPQGSHHTHTQADSVPTHSPLELSPLPPLQKCFWNIYENQPAHLHLAGALKGLQFTVSQYLFISIGLCPAMFLSDSRCQIYLIFSLINN